MTIIVLFDRSYARPQLVVESRYSTLYLARQGLVLLVRGSRRRICILVEDCQVVGLGRCGMDCVQRLIEGILIKLIGQRGFRVPPRSSTEREEDGGGGGTRVILTGSGHCVSVW